MKRIRTILLLALCLALAGCSASRSPVPEATAVPGTAPVLPGVSNADTQRVREKASFWFRFRDEPYLAPETRDIGQLAGQSYEMALLTALFAGPGIQNAELSSLFPQGTRVLSTSRQGRTLVVTLSREFTDGLPDEPADWRQDETWKTEMPLRRRLAMQSLVATVTENCDVDEIVVLIEQDPESTGSLRLPRSWFLTDEADDALAGPQTRDSACLLTPSVTCGVIMNCLLERDWSRLYLYVSSSDAYGGSARPSESEFSAAMQACPALISFSCTGCSVSMDGQEAVLSVNADIRQANGQTRTVESRIVRLTRDGGIWKIGMSGLNEWLEG